MDFLFDDDKISEKEIQILYQTHPYLIERRFLNQEVVPQYNLQSGYADIVVFMENEIVVIELKVEPMEYSHLLQLNGYLDDFKKELENDRILRGILIGKEPKDDLYSSVKILSYEIRIMILGNDICTKIKICDVCRLANDIKEDNCIYCFNDSFI